MTQKFKNYVLQHASRVLFQTMEQCLACHASKIAKSVTMWPLVLNVQKALSLPSATPLPAANYALMGSSLTQETPAKTAFPGANSATTTTHATNAFRVTTWSMTPKLACSLHVRRAIISSEPAAISAWPSAIRVALQLHVTRALSAMSLATTNASFSVVMDRENRMNNATIIITNQVMDVRPPAKLNQITCACL